MARRSDGTKELQKKKAALGGGRVTPTAAFLEVRPQYVALFP